MTPLTNIEILKEVLKETQDEVARLSAEIEQARTILAGTAIGSLPNDYPLSKLALETWNTLQDRTLEGLSFIGRMEAVVAAYDKQNPMRTADCHNPNCDCLRCAVDNIRNRAFSKVQS